MSVDWTMLPHHGGAGFDWMMLPHHPMNVNQLHVIVLFLCDPFWLYLCALHLWHWIALTALVNHR